jgi:asparagine synthase
MVPNGCCPQQLSDEADGAEAAMRWLVGWSSAAAGPARGTAVLPLNGDPDAEPYADETVRPVAGQLLWGDPDPLWAVGDWRPDEIRVVHGEAGNSLAVFGCCGASDEQLRAGLSAARGGALKHLTAWPGSYTAVVRTGRRITIAADLAGLRPVFHTPWKGGTAYATAALPLADLTEAQLDIPYLGALLACPDTPEALGDGTPYAGVRRVPTGHALILRDGRSREIAGYEPHASLVLNAPPAVDAETAVAAVRDALVEAVRTRLAAPRHVAAAHFEDRDPGPVPGMGPAERRAARGMRGPAPGIGADLSGGPASGTLALLAAGLPGVPGILFGAGSALGGASAGERLLAVTYNDLAAAPAGRLAADPDAAEHLAELERARLMADNPRLHHVVVTGEDDALPYAALDGVPLTDEPAPSLVTVERHRRRLGAGSADHFVGLGARAALDAHPARLADLFLDRRRRHLVRPAAALARVEGAERGLAAGRTVLVPVTVYRAARRLARTPYREGLVAAAARLRDGRFPTGAGGGAGAGGSGGAGAAGGGVRGRTDGLGAVDAALAALSWCRPGPAARWLTGETLADVSRRLERAAAGRPVEGRPGELRARAALTRHAADQRILEQAAEIRGQRLHAPFYDNQVVRACRALPETVRVKPGARAAVLRAVLAGAGVHDLPPGWGAPSRATEAAAVRTGLRVAAGDLGDLFDAPLLADAGLVEARVVRRALQDAADGVPLPLDGLADLVSTELWLRRLLARRGTCWTGTSAPRRRAAAAVVAPTPRRPAL